jgi:hypothetical protein
MKRPHLLFILLCLLAATLAAQTEIGGGTCSSATLSGTYAMSLTGRQFTASGNITNLFQSSGLMNFDGLGTVTISLTAFTLASAGTSFAASAGTPLAWSGTYSMQSNCIGLVTITSGGSATFNVVSYDNGVDFLLTGNDATYAYTGSGNTQPTAACSTSALAGLYSFGGTGYETSGSGVIGSGDVAGTLQFDGQGNVIVNVLVAGLGNSSSQGPYSVSSNCLGKATLAASNGRDTFSMIFSVSSGTAVASTDFFATFAFDFSNTGAPESVFVSGSSHAISGQPTASAANRGAGVKPAGNALAMLWSAAGEGRAK